MQRSSNFGIFGFALAVCLVISVGLALASTSLSEAQDVSARLDVIKNILTVAGYSKEKVEKMAAEDRRKVIELYEKRFEVRLVDKSNEEVPIESVKTELKKLGYTDESLDPLAAFEIVNLFNAKLPLLAGRAGQSKEEYDPGYNLLFLYKPEGEVAAYIVPIEGNGLWNMIFGYIALEPDLNTVRDVVFYKHEETPGLGGEISTPVFTDQFKGKKLLDSEGNFRSISVVKGGAATSGEAAKHQVDGISGGTITGDGVTDFLKSDLGRYNSYFKTIREAGAATDA